jgi:hypothetical protein
MASHHKHHMKMKMKRGGATSEEGGEEYDAQGSHEMKEVHEKKHGGKVAGHKGHGEKGKHRMKKARGGGIGSDKSPFSSAGRGGMSDHPADHGSGLVHGSGGGHGFVK